MIYFGLLHSHIQYGCIVWLSKLTKTKQDQLSIIQKKAIRSIYKLEYNAHTEAAFQSSRIIPVNSIFENEVTKFALSLKNNTAPSYFLDELNSITPLRPTRASNKGDFPLHHTTNGHVWYHILKELNKL